MRRSLTRADRILSGTQPGTLSKTREKIIKLTMASSPTKLILITGSNRGFGAAVLKALLASPEFGDQGHYVLLNRSESVGADNDKPAHHTKVSVDMAFSQAEGFVATLTESLAPLISSGPFQSVMLINNAGSLGPLVTAAQLCDSASSVADAITINVTAPLLLTSLVLKLAEANPHLASVDVVNVSSLAATTPFEYWSVYCSGKAHRDMFVRCLAHESAKLSSSRPMRFLNYAPGPLDTDMQGQIRGQMPADSELGKAFQDMHDGQKLVNPLDSATKLIGLLNKTFENGAHIDYFDVTD